MIQSMTGFGKADGEINLKKINVEIKSLNSKQADISIRMSPIYKEKELPLRALISQTLQRGKIEYNLYVEQLSANSKVNINADLFKKYHAEFTKIAKDLDESDNTNLIAIISKMPDILKPEKEGFNDDEWIEIIRITKIALNKLNEFRSAEGSTLKTELSLRISNIADLLAQVSNFEKMRIAVVKERIQNLLIETVGKENINNDRFEQELIYYLEKYDITEEKTRLKAHLNYFSETLESSISEGKKLGFISQEIGREINTLGSKANNADLQKIVVQMKNELEKIKEQTLNVL